MYAVIKTGGKQYRVAAGETLRVESIGAIGTAVAAATVVGAAGAVVGADVAGPAGGLVGATVAAGAMVGCAAGAVVGAAGRRDPGPSIRHRAAQSRARPAECLRHPARRVHRRHPLAFERCAERVRVTRRRAVREQ